MFNFQGQPLGQVNNFSLFEISVIENVVFDTIIKSVPTAIDQKGH